MAIAFNNCLRENDDYNNLVFSGNLSPFRKTCFPVMFNEEMHTPSFRVRVGRKVFVEVLDNINRSALNKQLILLERNIYEKREEEDAA